MPRKTRSKPLKRGRKSAPKKSGKMREKKGPMERFEEEKGKGWEGGEE